MPNPIKYSTGSETLALKKGNFYIGTGAVGKGPTSETGYYNGITPPTGGYTIYLNKESNGPSIYTASNDAELISLTNSIAGQSYTGAQQCFDYFYGQTDKVLINQDYPSNYPYIVMDGLILHLDASITQSYSGSGTVWSDVNGLGPKNNATLINGPTFNSEDGGIISFDGTNDFTMTQTVSGFKSLCFWVYWTGFGPISWKYLLDARPGMSDGWFVPSENSQGSSWKTTYYVNNVQVTGCNVTNVPINRWNFIYLEGVDSSYTSTIHFMARHSNNEQAGGKIGAIYLYNRALTTDEITQNYNVQKGRFGL
jgi:hypothetical protein